MAGPDAPDTRQSLTACRHPPPAEPGRGIDPSDHLRPGAGVISRVLAGLHPGAIVIMLDRGGNGAQTVAALPAGIRAIRAVRYHIVPACAG